MSDPTPDDLLSAWEKRMKERIEREEAEAAKEAEKLRQEYERRRASKIKL